MLYTAGILFGDCGRNAERNQKLCKNNSAERKDYGPCAPAFIENTMPNGIRMKAHRKDEAIRPYAAALRLFCNVRRKNDKHGRTDTKRIKVYVGFVFDTQTL